MLPQHQPLHPALDDSAAQSSTSTALILPIRDRPTTPKKAGWKTIPEELRRIVLEYVLANRIIQEVCRCSDLCRCNLPPRTNSNSLSLLLVSKDFVDSVVVAQVLFSSATAVITAANQLNYMTQINASMNAFDKLRHLEISSKCIPIASRIIFSLDNLKTLFPVLQTIDIKMTSPLHCFLRNTHELYAHAFEARRLLIEAQGHDDSFSTDTWPSPTPEQVAAAKEENSVRLPPVPATGTDYLLHNLLFFSIRKNVEDPIFVKVNPYLTAWHARLIDDANSQSSVEVRVHTTLKIKARLPPGIWLDMFVVRSVKLSTRDMLLRFELAGTEVIIPQLLDHTQFDSRFKKSKVSRWFGLNLWLDRKPLGYRKRSVSMSGYNRERQEETRRMLRRRGSM